MAIAAPRRTITSVTALILAAAMNPAPAQAQDDDTSYSVLMNQDNFFGFYPSFNGLWALSDTMDFSFYGILWTRDAFGTTGTGDDLWTEFGAGVNLKYMGGDLNVKPQVGITNGSLLSGGAADSNGTGGLFMDGIVPSLTVNYATDAWEAEWYSGYYLAARDDDVGPTNDFLHVWANGGYRFSEMVSAGVHWEWLEQTDGLPDGAEETVYVWAGPYVQFALPQGFFARLSAGSDVSDDGTGDFYKVNMGFSF